MLASATCYPPTIAQLRALDRGTDDQPERVLSEVARRLAEPATAGDALLRGELHAIASQAEVQASRPDEVRRHIDAGRVALAELPPGPPRDRLALHLSLAESDELTLTGKPEAATRVLEQALAGVPATAKERSCLLSARGLIRYQAHSLADAGADGIEAYEIARVAGDDYARVNAAYLLAAIYARAGLNPQAESAIGEAVAYAEHEHLAHFQMLSAFVQARVLQASHKYEEALASARHARALALQAAQPMGVSAATLSVCVALVDLARIDEADATCPRDDAVLLAAQRSDLAGELRAQRARIAIARHRNAEALGLLDGVLKPGATPVGPVYLARYHRYRADAHHAMGDLAGELADLRQAEALEETVNTQEHVNAVAVMGATAERVRWLSSQRQLQARLDSQRAELATQRVIRNLWIALAAFASVMVTLLAWLLRESTRQRQELRRQGAILGTVLANAPDALVLLDEEGRVRFANRGLFGEATPPLPGARLVEAVPAALATSMQRTLDSVFHEKAAVAALTLDGERDAQARYFAVHGAPVSEGGRLVGAVVRAADVTATHRLEREVVEASGRERLRLAGDLHEGLGQQLTGLSLLAKSLVASLDRGRPVARESLVEIEALLAECIDEVRAAAREMSPIAVERGSLGDALRRLAHDAVSDGPSIQADAVQAELVVGEDAAEHLYRIAREALANATQHSGATRVSIELARRDDVLVLAVADDGRGLERVPEGPGIGLRMIDYRARLLGGAVAIEPVRPSGTRISVTVPWSRCRCANA